MTTDPQTDRIPITRSVSYAVRGAPEMPAHGAAVPGTTLAPTQVTFTYRDAPDSQLGRVQARVKGFWVRDGGRVNPGQPVAQHYFGDLADWPKWLAGEARLHDPEPAAVSSPPPDQTLRDRIAAALYERERPPRDPHWPDVYAADREVFEAMVDAVLAVLPPPTDRAAVLLWAADFAEEVAERLRAHHEFERSTGALDVMTELRRLAAEAPQQPEAPLATDLHALTRQATTIWGATPTPLPHATTALAVVAGDIARQARASAEGRPVDLVELGKEFGNLILSAVRWMRDAGLDPDDCVRAALEAQQRYAARLADHDPAETQQQPTPGPYRHFKGGSYDVVANARHTESGERMVVYRSGDDWWCRPVGSFTSDVTVDGETRSRFAPAAEAQQRPDTETPASTAPLAAGFPLVKGNCPACRHASLFLGTGGYPTCANHECPEPDAATTVLEQYGREAHEPSHAWTVESPRRGQWASWGATYDDDAWARERYEDAIRHVPSRAFRLVRATTTHTVEAEHTPAADAQPVEPHPTEVDVCHALKVLDAFQGRDADQPDDEDAAPDTGDDHSCAESGCSGEPTAVPVQPVRHAPGTAVLCPDCRAKGYAICMADEQQANAETRSGCPDPIECSHEAALGEARATNQRLNFRAQQLESELAAYRRAVGQWEVSEDCTYVPLRTLATIAKAAGLEVPERWELHYERVEQAEAAIARVCQLHDRLAEETGLASPDDSITRGAAAKRIAAALDGWTPPAVPVQPAAADTREETGA